MCCPALLIFAAAVVSGGDVEVKNSTYMLAYGPANTDTEEVALDNATQLLKSDNYNPTRCIALYIFGKNNAPDNKFTREVLEAYLSTEQYNVLLLNWKASSQLSDSYNDVEPVARRAAVGLSALLKGGARLCHIAGHSFGAHLAGFLARETQARGQTVPHIVGLDPARSKFDGWLLRPSRGLQRRDASCVAVVSSDVGAWGTQEHRGSVEFYINSGARPQPGCSDTRGWFGSMPRACSHMRALHVWASAVRQPGSVVGSRCDSWHNFQGGLCDGNPTAVLGKCSSEESPQQYYMETNDKPPFVSTNPKGNV